jgi:hypothetical protein
MNLLGALWSFDPRISIPENGFVVHHVHKEVGLSIHSYCFICRTLQQVYIEPGKLDLHLGYFTGFLIGLSVRRPT